MPHVSDREKPDAIDFATRTVFDSGETNRSTDECRATVRELIDTFGLACFAASLPDDLMRINAANEEKMQALRGLCLLVLESDRPKLTAQLVGKLVKLELATGRRIHLRELGRINHISKQAVSNRLKHIAARLNLPRPDSLPLNRRQHQLMNRRNYGKRTCPAGTPARDTAPSE